MNPEVVVREMLLTTRCGCTRVLTAPNGRLPQTFDVALAPRPEHIYATETEGSMMELHTDAPKRRRFVLLRVEKLTPLLSPPRLRGIYFEEA